VEDEYERRITELQIRGGLLGGIESIQLDCDAAGRVWVARYGSTKRPAARIQSGERDVIAYEVVDHDGARYVGSGVAITLLGDDHPSDAIRVEWMDGAETCTRRPFASTDPVHPAPCARRRPRRAPPMEPITLPRGAPGGAGRSPAEA